MSLRRKKKVWKYGEFERIMVSHCDFEKTTSVATVKFVKSKCLVVISAIL